MPESGAIIQLLGYPATGKYTIGREIVRLLSDDGHVAKLHDNHLTANLIFDLVPRFGPDGIPADVVRRVVKLREVVLDAIEDLSPREWSFVFTNFLPASATPHAIDRHRALALARESTLLPVVLACEPDELTRRVEATERKQRLKLTDPVRLRAVLEGGMTVPDWPELRTLDVTTLSAADAARSIVDMLPPRGSA